jgi:hypothetical protein
VARITQSMGVEHARGKGACDERGVTAEADPHPVLRVRRGVLGEYDEEEESKGEGEQEVYGLAVDAKVSVASFVTDRGRQSFWPKMKNTKCVHRHFVQDELLEHRQFIPNCLCADTSSRTNCLCADSSSLIACAHTVHPGRIAWAQTVHN